MSAPIDYSEDLRGKIHPEHLADLAKSGLSEVTIHEAGLSTVRPCDVSQLLKWNPVKVESALAFPYPGNGFTRLKVFPPYHDDRGHRVKYLQPRKSPPHLYIPASAAKILKDPTIALAITEGEKKALKACQEGIPCLGVGGLWNWIQEGQAIPDLDAIAWANRTISIFPDSDIWGRPDLVKAVYALGKELEGRGAAVLVVLLPGGVDPKTGLDDFLQQNSLKELQKLSRLKLNHKTFGGAAVWWKTWKPKPPTDEAPQELPVTSPMSPEAREEALALLCNPELLSAFLRDIETYGSVGEKDNSAYLCLAYTSRKLSSPLNTVIKAESSAGKNHLAGSVADFFPPEDVIRLSSASTKALFHTTQSLKHKLMLIAERPGSEDADYSIRTLQSEGRIEFWVVDKNDKGQNQTVVKVVEGPVAFLETTTRAHLHAENESRTFDLYLDESEEQTGRIHAIQARRHTTPGWNEGRQRLVIRWQNAQRLLTPCPVLIPFAEKIPFPTKPLRVRRDRPKFMALIEASAFFHQYQRPREKHGEVTYVMATLDDYAIARELIQGILKHVLPGATPKCRALVEKAKDLGEEFTQTILGGALGGWSRTTVKKYLEEAIGLGCVEADRERGPYRFVKLVEEASLGLLTREELAALLGSIQPVQPAENYSPPADSLSTSALPIPGQVDNPQPSLVLLATHA